jgi:amino acid transporter
MEGRAAGLTQQPGRQVPETFDAGRRLQMLGSEYSGLTAARSMAWGEAFARAGMFLTVLSGAVVALALVSQAAGFGDQFRLFALLLLPVVLFVGVATYARVVQVNNEDFIWLAGLNRIRHAWVELDPGIEPYLVTAQHDDARGIARSYAVPDATFGVAHAFVTVPGMIGVVVAVVAAALAALAVLQLRGSDVVAVVAGVMAFVAMIMVLALYQLRAVTALSRIHVQRFPTPQGPPSAAPNAEPSGSL